MFLLPVHRVHQPHTVIVQYICKSGWEQRDRRDRLLSLTQLDIEWKVSLTGIQCYEAENICKCKETGSDLQSFHIQKPRNVRL